jgi:hypothetical protein
MAMLDLALNVQTFWGCQNMVIPRVIQDRASSSNIKQYQAISSNNGDDPLWFISSHYGQNSTTFGDSRTSWCPHRAQSKEQISGSQWTRKNKRDFKVATSFQMPSSYQQHEFRSLSTESVHVYFIGLAQSALVFFE